MRDIARCLGCGEGPTKRLPPHLIRGQRVQRVSMRPHLSTIRSSVRPLERAQTGRA